MKTRVLARVVPAQAPGPRTRRLAAAELLSMRRSHRSSPGARSNLEPVTEPKETPMKNRTGKLTAFAFLAAGVFAGSWVHSARAGDILVADCLGHKVNRVERSIRRSVARLRRSPRHYLRRG